MSEQRLKALWLPSWYPTSGDPTAGIFTQRDAEAVSLFCDVVVLFVSEEGQSGYEIEENVISESFTEIRILYPTGKRWSKIIRYTKAYIKGFRCLYKRGFRTDILHLHVMWPAGIAALYFYFRYRPTLFISEHWSGYKLKHDSLSKWRVLFLRSIIRNACVIFTVNQDIAKAMQGYGLIGKYVVNPNVVKTDTTFLKKEGYSAKFKFIHVSNLKDQYKNISGILKAVHFLTIIRDDFELIIVGGDEGTIFYEDMAVELGVESSIRFVGVIEHKYVLKLMASCDALVLFSNHEGLPCVMLEALSAGIPVISTALPGFSEWITPDTGVLVSVADIAELVVAMDEIIDNYSRYNPELIRKKVRLDCSYRAVGNRIFIEYQRALCLTLNE